MIMQPRHLIGFLWGQLSGVIFEAQDNTTINVASVTIYRGGTSTAAVVGTDLHSADTNPAVTTFNGAYTFRAIPGDYTIVITAAGYNYPSEQTAFPAGRNVITGSMGETFTVASSSIAMDHPVDFNGELLRIEKDANKSEAHVAEIVTYTVTIENIGTIEVNNVLLEDMIPPGFKYLNNRMTLDGIPVGNPTGTRPLLFAVNDFAIGVKKTLKYQLIIGSGVTLGDYDNTARARYASGQYLSNRARETVEIVLDPLFDLGSIIGKVFLDHNANGIQDRPKDYYVDIDAKFEGPVPYVRIVMEDGTVITTDVNGRFSAPGIMPGRHLFRLDERSLPGGSYLTTDKVVIVDVTEGSINKVNFGVNFDAQRFSKQDQEFFRNKVLISQEKAKPNPRLNVSLFGGEIAVSQGVFVEEAEFRIFTNLCSFY